MDSADLKQRIGIVREYWAKHDVASVSLYIPGYKQSLFLGHHIAVLKQWGHYEEMLFFVAPHIPRLDPDVAKILFRAADRKRLLACGDPLPEGEHFVLYRGISSADIPEYRRNVFWTLNPYTAAWFARRFGHPNPAVYTLTVPRDNVFYYTNDRAEQEMVVDVWTCGDVKRVEPMPPPIHGSKKNDALMQLDLTRIAQYAQSKFRCAPHSVHGLGHWRRVLEHGLRITEESGADVIVVTLFALLHDVCRLNDGADPGHGKRAAELVGAMQGDLFKLTSVQLETLQKACRLHTAGTRSQDATIGTCWDADRLDLGRVDIPPNPERMSTVTGQKKALDHETLDESYMANMALVLPP